MVRHGSYSGSGMAFYHERIVPYLIALAMRQRNLVEYRKRVVSAAEGRVLEIGIGSGMNIPFYGPGVGQIPASILRASCSRC